MKLEKIHLEELSMCGNNSCFGGNLWWIIILILLFNCGGCGCGNNDCGCGNNDNGRGGCGCF